MSTGIVVRVIAPLIKHKTEDPAVFVDDIRLDLTAITLVLRPEIRLSLNWPK
jgi:hypothetical protein